MQPPPPWNSEAGHYITGPGLVDDAQHLQSEPCAGPESPDAPPDSALEQALFTQHAMARLKRCLAEIEAQTLLFCEHFGINHSL